MHYRITVRGHLDHYWSAWFDGLTVTNGDDGHATLAGPIMDQATLFGLLMKILDLGLPLVAVVSGTMSTNDDASDELGQSACDESTERNVQ